MANIENIVAPFLHFEAGVKKQYLTLPHERLFAIAKKTGFANDPDDRGGATMCGVTLATFDRWCFEHHQHAGVQALKNITLEQWKSIMKEYYWDYWRADSINSEGIADMLVDWVWASGGAGTKIVQRLVGVVDDGMVGPKTISAINSCNARNLFDGIKSRRLAFVDGIVKRNPSQGKFIVGWKNRINSITLTGFVI
jgi:lysozyme family protein